jgi:hypothetical protein
MHVRDLTDTSISVEDDAGRQFNDTFSPLALAEVSALVCLLTLSNLQRSLAACVINRFCWSPSLGTPNHCSPSQVATFTELSSNEPKAQSRLDTPRSKPLNPMERKFV